MATTSLQEYIISYSKEGITFPLNATGLNDFRKVISAQQEIAIQGTDYVERATAGIKMTVVSFITRPDENTISFHRVWSDKDAGDTFYALNETTVFENWRKDGWTVTCTSKEFNPANLNGSDITLI